MTAFPFLGGSFNGRSPSFDAQRTVNLYFEASESQSSRSAGMLVGTPGLETWVDLGDDPIRGCLRFDANTAIVVSGSNVWRVTSDRVTTLIGAITPGGAVSMASNGSTVMLVDGVAGWFIEPANAYITPVNSDSFQGADRVDFLDGYFVWNKPNTGQFQISGLYSTTIDGLDYATAEGSPDNIVSLIVDHRELWLMGQNSTEVWYNVGDPDFPFQRIQGAFLEVGCAAPLSVAKLDNSIFWLATDDRGFGTVQRAVGYSPQRVSNHAVEFAIASYTTIADAVAYTYAQEGHSFYVLSFPSAGATWVFDAATNLWHERASVDPATGLQGRHRSNCQMAFAGMTLVGDYASGKLFRMDLDVFDDDGLPIHAIRRCPHIANDTKYVLFNLLELTMQTGVGLVAGQGSDPQAMLRWSDDGGYSWSNEHWASIGAMGERHARVRWRRLGRSRDRIFEVRITDPVRRVITGASLQTVGCLA